MRYLALLNGPRKDVYLDCVRDPGSCKYNVAMRFDLPRGTDEVRWLAAVKTVLAAHPALHTVLGMQDGEPAMFLCEGELPVTVRDAEDPDAAAAAFVRPFDLANGPLCRAELCRTPKGSALFFDAHHTVCDGTSVQILLAQFVAAYRGEAIPPEEMTAFEAAESERSLADTARYRAAKEYFKAYLAGADGDSKPFPDRVEAGELHGSARFSVSSDGFFTQKDAEDFAHANGLPAATLFLGAFAYALSVFNGTPDALFCTASHGRHDPRLQNTVGMFVKTLPVYIRPDTAQSPAAFLTKLRADFHQTMENDCVPFGELVKECGASLDVAFVYQGKLFSGAVTAEGQIPTEPIELPENQSALDGMLLADGDGYRMLLHYDKALYTEALMRGFADLFFTVVRGMLSAPTLGEIPLLSDAGQKRLDAFNRTETPYPADKTVVDRFRAQAKRTPERTCLVFDGKAYTYAETDALTDALAAHLVKCGVGREKVVGILIMRSEYMLLCALGVLKAGGAYLPLDPSYPPERLHFMVEDSGAMLLLYDPALSGIGTDAFTGVRMPVTDIPALPPCDIPLPTPSPGDLFVMLYTSGSTGKPKGVLFTHGNAHVSVEFFRRYFEMDESTRLLSYASYGFDAHVIDLYPPILAGGTLHILKEELRLDLPAVRTYCNENGITHAVMTTQLGRQFALLGGFTSLRHLSVAGEKLTPLPLPQGFKFYNLYGPTEGSVITSAFRMERQYKDVPIGQAVDNLKLYVVNAQGKRLPAGAVGELWIAGPHVTRGYQNRPDKQAEAYGENPFENIPGYGRIYRTGDIVRLLTDGNLQFVGRRDMQVKVRGFRVELTEIEEVVRRYPGIKDATVAAFDEPSGGKFVAAYIVSDPAVDTDALRAFIRAEKPPYMVPAAIMQIDRIPLNQNHKVDRRALPKPVRRAGVHTPPATEMQKKLYEIVAEVLGHRDFGIGTDFDEAGLTSIGAVRLHVALAGAFDTAVRLSDLREHPTVRALEAFFADAKAEKPLEKYDDYPITKTQSGIFVECMASPDSTAYNIPLCIRLGEGTDLIRLQKAIRAALDAHPYAKATLFTDAHGDVRARREDGAPVRIESFEKAALPPESELIRPFKLLDSPLYRIELYKTDAGNFLFMDFHHILSDGTSEGILLADIDRAFAGETLAPERFSGFEAGLWEAEARASERFAAAKDYWKGVLSGCETSCLPKKEPDGHGAGHLDFDALAISPVEDWCKARGLTENAFFNAAFGYVMQVFSGKESLTHATVYNGRSDSRLARSVTMLVKTLPMVSAAAADTKVEDLVRKMQKQLLLGMENDLYSFAELSAEYGVNADLLLVYQGDSFAFDTLCGESAEFRTLAASHAKAPAALSIFKQNGRYVFTAEYDRAAYSESFIRALCEALSAAAAAFTQCTRIGEVSLLTPYAEGIYERLNASDTVTEPLGAHALFARQAAAHPDAPALLAAGKRMTYGELNAAANRLAHALLAAGVGADTVIGLVLDRTVEVLIAELGILKAGGAFLPMLPTYPDERIDFCLRNAESPYLLTTEAIRAQKPELFGAEKPYRTLTAETLLQTENTADPDVPVTMEQMAYCIYTSGSTGTPKGVMITHGNFSNFVQTDPRSLRYYTEPHDGCAMASSSISFDMSLYELFLPLCAGRCVCMISEEEFHDPMALCRTMTENRVQMMVCTPSFLNNFVSMPETREAVAGLCSLVVGAEAFPSALYETLREISPDLQIVNGYGPTEATVCCSDKELHDGEHITIGRPTGNVKLYVVDRAGKVLPPYGIGELMICGAGVGRGYVKLPEKTAASFCTLRSLPAYRSGDLVRLTGDGEIDFGGRIDNQIKLRGFRVELDEIEKAICAYGPVRQSKVLVRNNGKEDYLVGFFTAERSVELSALTAFLRARLPYYMVPAALAQLAAMPLTPNGKIDKNGFPEIRRQTAEKAKRRAPKKSLEQRLCDIYAEILSTEVFADDNFFEMGGTSLSASKVTMLLMSDGIEVKYGDIFDHPTPESLAAFIGSRVSAPAEAKKETGEADSRTRPALMHNVIAEAASVTRRPLGNVLLTGAVGFLGVHILRELIESEKGHIYCLVRRGRHESAEIRLKTMLIYYFSDGFADALRDRITVIEADITEDGLESALAPYKIDTVINCAACVKHFSNSNILEEINVGGVKNLIRFCKAQKARLIQISTVSVPGMHTEESYAAQVRMHENELFVIDDMANKYVLSKYNAELCVFDAIERDGLDAKVIRVGNLMGRHSDGEFQVNMETNMFISGIRGFAVMGKYPISHMTDPMRFSPVDCTAKAVVLLAGTDKKFTAFHADNRYGFDEMKLIDACCRCGIQILPEADESYYAAFRKKLGESEGNDRLNGLAAYDIKDAHAVETDNRFTTNILYRIGFSWPLTDDAYLDRAIRAVMTLDYFGPDMAEDGE